MPALELVTAERIINTLVKNEIADTYLLVDFVHGGEVVHIFEVNVDLHDLLPGRASSLQHVTQISNALRLDACQDILFSWKTLNIINHNNRVLLNSSCN